MKTYRIDDDRSLWELARDIVAQRRRRKMSEQKDHPPASEQLADLRTKLEADARAKGVSQEEINRALGDSIGKQKGISTSPSHPVVSDDELQARVLGHYKAGEQIMRFFVFAHLKPEQRAESRKWALLAVEACETLPRSSERAAGLRKLIEAKDCFVRASLPEIA